MLPLVPFLSRSKLIVMLIGHQILMTGDLLQGHAFTLTPTLSRGGLKRRHQLLNPMLKISIAVWLTASEVLWIHSLLQELQVLINTPVIYCDNESMVASSHNPLLHLCTKHMELDIFIVREKVLSKSLVVTYVSAEAQIVDILTKSLPRLSYATYETNSEC